MSDEATARNAAELEWRQVSVPYGAFMEIAPGVRVMQTDEQHRTITLVVDTSQA